MRGHKKERREGKGREGKEREEGREGICSLGLLSGRPFYQLKCQRGFGDVTVPHLRKNKNGGVGIDACIRFVTSPASFQGLGFSDLTGFTGPNRPGSNLYTRPFSLASHARSHLTQDSLTSEMTVADPMNHVRLPG